MKRGKTIYHDGPLDPFLCWCRDSNIPLLTLAYEVDGNTLYFGSKILLKENLFFHMVSRHIILDYDFDLIKIRFGREIRISKDKIETDFDNAF